jgi:CHAD domain-containing protein
MKLRPDQIEKPLKKLGKDLSTFPANPRPEDVHSLRTQTRRLEAVIAAVSLEREKHPRRLLKRITPVRKAAGDVRDMDVLIGDVLTMSGDRESEPAVLLVQHLARRRVKHARKLRDLLRKERRDISTHLRQSSKLIRKKMKDDGAPDSEAAPQILITELSHWPDLEEGNLHLFRIRTKELRYMLQLNDQADQKLVDALGEVKDTIGEWHDWVELEKIARKLLDPKSDSELLQRIRQTRGEKLKIALAAANRMRDKYFNLPAGGKTNKKILQMAS